MTPEIVFPMGLGGNHVRWLLSLDPKFDLKVCPATNPKDKADWICKNIYANRSWNTWLKKEWLFRNHLNSVIVVGHFLPIEDPNWQQKKQLILRADDYTATAYHYFMVNLGLNNQTLDVVMNECKTWEFLVEKVKSWNLPNKTILTSDCITEPTLSPDWYQKIIFWAGYSDLYEYASQIHTAYYQCRLNAAQDFVRYFEGPEFQKHLEFYKNYD